MSYYLYEKECAIGLIASCCSMFQGLGPLDSSESELTSETKSPFKNFGRDPLRRD